MNQTLRRRRNRLVGQAFVGFLFVLVVTLPIIPVLGWFAFVWALYVAHRILRLSCENCGHAVHFTYRKEPPLIPFSPTGLLPNTCARCGTSIP